MRPIALLLALLLPLLAACDGDDSPAAPTATPGASDASPAAVAQPTGQPPAPQATATTPAASPAPGSTDSFDFPALRPLGAGPALLVEVRVGAHEGFDRIVFEFTVGQRPSGLIEYREDVAQCGSGFPVDPAGSHTLAVRFDVTNAHTEAGAPSIPDTAVSGPGNSIVESQITCDFEAVVEWAIGVDGERPFTVTLLEDPNRVVIDVAH